MQDFDDWTDSSDLTPVNAVRVALTRHRLAGDPHPSLERLMSETGLPRGMVEASLEQIQAVDAAVEIMKRR